MIGRSGERGSGISMLAARHDNDKDMNKLKYKNFLDGCIPLFSVKGNQTSYNKSRERKIHFI